MSVMSSLPWAGLRHLIPSFLASSPAPLLRSPAPLLRTFASKSVKGHRKEKNHTLKPKVHKAVVEIQSRMTVEELAAAMDRDCDHVLEALLLTDLDLSFVGPHFVLEEKSIKEVVLKFGMRVRWSSLKEDHEKPVRDAQRRPPADPSLLVRRPPVVTIMGHVDHGKTTLLDGLRNSQITASEFGGITQHIGAFLVRLPSGESITFLDTPGHAAFSSIRARGASATDIIILVVAADDGVMNQTVECIQLAHSADVPVIVAVNKMDRPQADPQRVKQELASHGVLCEELGGDVQAVHISALKGDNLPSLAEAVVALAEVLELKAEPSGPAEGLVIESRSDKGKGPVTTTLVQRGVLKKGCVLVAGNNWAKVRSLLDENGHAVKEAGPSTAVQVIGWKELPSAGETFIEVESEQRAKQVACYRANVEQREVQQRETQQREGQQYEGQSHFEPYFQMKAELSHLNWRDRRQKLYKVNKKLFASRPSERVERETLSLPLIIKGDVDGSVETLLNVLSGYDAQHQCLLEVVHFGVGDVSDYDVNTAHAFGGSVYGFNVAAAPAVQRLAEKNKVPLHLHTIIYKLVEQLRAELGQKLPSRLVQSVVGEATVVVVFQVSHHKKKVPVAGVRVLKGQLDRKLTFRLIRGHDIVWEGPLLAMKHHKDEIQSAKVGVDCALSVLGDVDFLPGDMVVCFKENEEPQVTAWDPGF